jgi:hypothetical protein
MRNLTTSTSLSVLTLTALMMLPQPATAGCLPGVRSDSYENTCIGTDALSKFDSPYPGSNTAIGKGALMNLRSNSTKPLDSLSNTAVGANALSGSIIGRDNTAIGADALRGNFGGFDNVAVGDRALATNAYGYLNTAIGSSALSQNEQGLANTAVGSVAGQRSGDGNIALGVRAGFNQNGSYNIAIGAEGSDRDSKTIRIGTQGTQTQTFVAGIRGSTIRLGSVVMVDSNGQLGVLTSSARYKQDITPMGDASSRLMNLRPVSFRYKEPDSDGNKPMQYGLIAEEVEKVMPELVIRNADGSVETVAYQYLPSLLLNEYQKQNRELEETKAQLDAMQQEMAAMKIALGRLAAAAPQGSTLAAFKAEGAVALK